MVLVLLFFLQVKIFQQLQNHGFFSYVVAERGVVWSMFFFFLFFKTVSVGG